MDKLVKITKYANSKTPQPHQTMVAAVNTFWTMPNRERMYVFMYVCIYEASFGQMT